jgi:fumarate reductase flavoprotein subunit
MWDEVGILRDRAGLQRALARLDSLDAELAHCGIAGSERGLHIGWHDWMNLRNLIQVSRVITVSALAREDSRGAHYRADFPHTDSLESSACIVVQAAFDGTLALRRQPVSFHRVRPGHSLVGA